MTITRRGLARRSFRAFAIVATAALLVTTAHATTRTRRVASLQQSQQPSAVKPTPGKSSGKSAGRGDSASAKKTHPGSRSAAPTKAQSKSRPESQSKSRKHHRAEPEPVDDPIIIHRAKNSAGRRGPVETAKSRHAVSAPAVVAKAPASKPTKPATKPSSPQAIEVAATPAPDAAKKVATVDDFVRAAGSSAPGDDVAAAPHEAPITGESHPDDDERLPAHVVSAAHVAATKQPAPTVAAAKPKPRVVIPAVVASVEAPPAAPIERRAPAVSTEPERVDGFGAEGDLLTRPAGPAMHTRIVKTKKFEDTIPVTNDPELASLSRPTREETVEAAAQPQVLMRYGRNGRLIVPAPLKGSHEILVHQNTMADDAGLDRIQDEEDLDRMLDKHLLVSFPDIAALRVNPELPYNRRAARPWTVKFAADMARAYYAKFHQPLTLSSAVRTVTYQLRLQRVNGNAAAVDGEGASPHLTGQAVDFGKHGMSIAQIAWMRTYLAPLMDAGKIDVEEEFKQACFHISVYKSYLPASKKKPLPRTELATVRAPKVDADAK